LGYRGNMIKEYFLNYEAINNDFTICLGRQNCITYHEDHKEQGFKVTLTETGPDTMTGRGVKRVEKYIDERDNFMVRYGDGVADVDVSKLVEFHKSHGKLATVTTMRPIPRFGMLDVDNSGRVREFVEKPQVDGWASARYMILNRRILDYLGGR
jgi:glucose-1-phosphate cytidylyltransferase